MRTLFDKYTVIAEKTLESDGYIGIPVKISVLFDARNYSATPGYRKTPIIIYVTGANIERIGTESDEQIISRMISNGYVVTLLDYMNAPLACCPSLDYSVQAVRKRIIEGEFFADSPVFPRGKYSETIVVPAGYDVSYNNAYWAFDRHGADGDLEKIVEIWNNDFRGTNPERVIRWTDTMGNRKKTQNGHDGSEPEWCDADGNPSANGEYIRIKHTKAEDIKDCVKPDGSPIELNLYMHIVYPTAPAKKVPVMCLDNSSEDLCSGNATADRPHLLGFLFRGYAGVCYDYGYTPMARLDCYGYFDGFPKKGYITGDNATYALQFFDDKRINTAAMRFIRYLALTDEKIMIDTEKIGVYGNSKGSWNTFLGERNPEAMQSKRMHAGHHDETRFENGKTETVGSIRGGEEQPWLTYNGEKISGEAQLLYSSCGGVDDAITAGHAAMFISCNRRDGSCYSTSNAQLNVCRIYDVPTMWVDIPNPHTIVYGEELTYGFDTYRAFFDFTGYYLKGDAVKAISARINETHFPADVTIKFSGAIDISEASKLMICDSEGCELDGKWSSAFGGTEWTFTPDYIDYGTEYELIIPKNVIGKNGKTIQSEFSYKFKTSEANITEVEATPTADGLALSFTKICENEQHFLVFKIENGANTVGIYTKNGKKIGQANVSGEGDYKVDLTEYLDKIHCGESVDLILKSQYAKGSEILCDQPLSVDLNGVCTSENALCSLDKAPDGTPALKIDGFKTITSFPTEEFYSYPARMFTCNNIISENPVTEADFGRRFKISLRVFDTVSRYIRVELSHCTDRETSVADYKRNCYNIKTSEGEWIDVEFEYTSYEAMYESCRSHDKKLIVSGYGHGNEKKPIYFADIKTEETLTDIEISDIMLISCAKSSLLPDGQSDIYCQKSPWVKK